VLGINGGEIASEAEVRRAQGYSKLPALQPGSSITLIQFGAI
jgi:hypothetical protein